jgi:2-succinyl-6-hydroxy-2,4-cyclohexadiene-1-carboxylate synthase
VILSAAVDNGQPGYPWLVFLHGFSGDRNEWRKVGDAFPPGRGCTSICRARRLRGYRGAGLCRGQYLLQSTLNSYNIHKYWLIGYSLGGRVAMNFASQPRAGCAG